MCKTLKKNILFYELVAHKFMTMQEYFSYVHGINLKGLLYFDFCKSVYVFLVHISRFYRIIKLAAYQRENSFNKNLLSSGYHLINPIK